MMVNSLMHKYLYVYTADCFAGPAAVGCPAQHWHQDLTGPNVIVPLGRRDIFVGEEQVRRRW